MNLSRGSANRARIDLAVGSRKPRRPPRPDVHRVRQLPRQALTLSLVAKRLQSGLRWSAAQMQLGSSVAKDRWDVARSGLGAARPYRLDTTLLRRSVPWLLPLLAGGLSALLSVTFLARQDVRIGPTTVQLGARPAAIGTSTLVVPPIGSMSAHTHLGPMEFWATVDDVDVKRLGRLLKESPGPSGPSNPRFPELVPLEDQARQAATGFLLRIAVLGLAGGLAGVLLFRRRTRQRLLRCGVGGLAATVLLLGPTLATYDVGAFREPRYRGALESATTAADDPSALDRLRAVIRQAAEISGSS
jgi:hypothetical protein